MTAKKEKNKDRKEISRRRFIKTAGIALGVGAAACGGTAYFGLKTPDSVDFPEMTCQPGGGRRVLVAYASKCGATAETADFIGTRLCEMGCDVELKRARNVRDVSAYEAVILGSAVYMGKILGEAVSFAADILAELPDLPVAFFNQCLSAKGNTPEDQAQALAYMDPLREYATPAAIAAFPGRIDLKTLPPLYRLVAQADSEGILAEGDFRDWDAVSAWVDTLPAEFLPVSYQPI